MVLRQRRGRARPCTHEGKSQKAWSMAASRPTVSLSRMPIEKTHQQGVESIGLLDVGEVRCRGKHMTLGSFDQLVNQLGGMDRRSHVTFADHHQGWHRDLRKL